MKKLLIALLGLGVLGTCQADVLIYKIKVSETITGNGLTKKTPVTGYLVIDINTHELADIPVHSASFTIYDFTNIGYALVDAGNGKSKTAISFPGYGIGAVFATGLNSTLYTATATPTANYRAPKTMNVSGNEISANLSSTEIDSGTFIYDENDTVIQNGSGNDFATVVYNLQQGLLGRGLIQTQ